MGKLRWPHGEKVMHERAVFGLLKYYKEKGRTVSIAVMREYLGELEGQGKPIEAVREAGMLCFSSCAL